MSLRNSRDCANPVPDSKHLTLDEREGKVGFDETLTLALAPSGTNTQP
jgi:hypothetical protein